MFLATSNKTHQLVVLRYIGAVSAAELERNEPEMRAMVAEMPRGFQLLQDLSQLESMDQNCLPVIGRMMEFFDASGVGLVVRVIPDPAKDIGFNILTFFHYPSKPQIITCETLIEAGRHLEMGESNSAYGAGI